MTSIFGIINIGQQAIFANQHAIKITGNNIANVNTEGYSRQKAVFESNDFGLGVDVASIRRMRNDFFDVQKTSGMQKMGYLEIKSGFYTQIEEIFNESNEDGLSASINNFFQSMQDLASNPYGTAERDMATSQGEILSDMFNLYYKQLEDLQKDTDSSVKQTVTQINTLTARIADLNSKVGFVDAKFPPTALLDERAQLLNELANLADIHYYINDDGAATVFVGGGTTLVEGNTANELKTVINPSNKSYSDVIMVDHAGIETKINDKIKGGKLYGLIETRDSIIPGELKKLDTLAATLNLNLNLQHRQGFGLDGVDGRDFFDMLEVFAQGLNENEGNARVTASSVTDPTLLTLDDYEVRFTSAAQYDIVNTTTGATIVAGAAYTSGNAITFDGMSITITNGSTTPQTGDIFEVNSTTNAAKYLSITSDIADNPQYIAAGLTDADGDNENAVLLANLEDALLLNNGISNFSDYLSSQIGSIGSHSNVTQQQALTQEGIMGQIENYIASVSGVSLDEEAVNLILFQRAFEASAKIIQTVDEMLLTVLDLKS